MYFVYALFALTAVLIIMAIGVSFGTLHADPKHCHMVHMSSTVVEFSVFNDTRFASKYTLYLYREQHIDIEFDSVGAPVIFIPGNAGSFRQVLAIAAASSVMHHAAEKMFAARNSTVLTPPLNLAFLLSTSRKT
jgi:hypothetical protein